MAHIPSARQASPGIDPDAQLIDSLSHWYHGCTKIRGVPSEVLLTPDEDGVLVDSVVNANTIQTVQKTALGAYLTHLSQDRMREVREAIEYALGFDAMR